MTRWCRSTAEHLNLTRIFVFVLLALLGPVAVLAQATPEADSSLSAVPSALQQPLADYQLAPEQLKQAAALYRTRMLTYVVSTVYGLVLLVVLLNLKVAVRCRDLAIQTSPRRFVQVLIFAPLLLLTIDVLSLPIGIFQHRLSMSYGLSVQGWGSWFWDWIKGEFVTTLIATLLMWGLYAILRRSPQRWWLYAWLATIPVAIVLVFVQPVFIDPLFNKFDPLEQRQPALVVALQKVMQRGGLTIDRSRMFEMRASDKVTTYNAYVTGIGASKRVVVWDNTARDMTIPQTMFIFGHEQGHYALHHIWKGLLLAIAGLLAVAWLAYWLSGTLIRRHRERWQIHDPADWASLPLLLLIFTALSVVSQPLSNGISRYMEHQADVYALEVLHGLVPDSTQAATQAFQKLGEKALAYPTPHPLYVWWAYSHPAVAERLRFAAGYQPWSHGEAQFIR